MPETVVTLDKICSMEVLRANPADPVLSILHRMRRARISSMVITEYDKPVGMITEKDIIRLVTVSDKDLTELCAEDVMTSPVVTMPASEDFQAAYQEMQRRKLRHIVVINDAGHLRGIASETDFVQHLGFEYLAEIKHVEAVMERVLVYTPVDATLRQAFEIMSEKQISSVIVGDECQVEGILTERDVIRLLDDRVELDEALVGQYMSSPVKTIDPGTSLLDARQMMQERNVRRLLVKDKQGYTVGLLTRQNLIDRLQTHFIRLMRDAIEQLHVQLENSRSKEIHYRGFFESSPLAYQSLDQQGNFIEVNQSWRQMLGYSNGELVGTPFAALLAPGQEEKFKLCFQGFKQAGEAKEVTYFLQSKNGTTLEIQFDGQVVRDDEGRFIRTHCVLTNVTKQKQIDSQLKLFRRLIDSSNDALFVIDAATAHILDLNDAACRYLEYTRDELLNTPVTDFSEKISTMSLWLEKCSQIRKSQQGVLYESAHITRTGKKIPVEISSTLQEAHGKDVIVSTVRDISERKAAERRLQEESNFLQAIIDSIGDPVMVIDTDFQVIKANREARDYYFNGESPGNEPCYRAAHSSTTPCHQDGLVCPLRDVIETNSSTTIVHEHTSSQGESRIFELMASPLYGSDGKISGIVESSRDITEHIKIQKALEEKERSLDHLAHHDPLTQLPNRLLFTDRLEQALRSAKRDNSGVALLFIDLDEFKEINDSFGHNLGDRLLKQVSLRLIKHTRDSDTIARLGGDEFTVITSGLTRPEDAAIIAQHLLEAFKEPIKLDQQRLHISLSIGISLYPDDADNAEALIRNADTAMYRAKSAGKNRYEFYTQDMTDQAFERILMVGALRNAIEQEQFVLHYQPQYDLRSGEIIGAEALIRWRDEQLGLIEPDRFIPVAEKTGLIHGIDIWVLNQVCKTVKHWECQGITLPRISVNISARHFGSNSLAREVTEILSHHNCCSTKIELEVTESVILNNPARASLELNQLREMGIHLAIDDFGTGYSSLAYLKKLPLDRLKIDRSFISDIPDDKNDEAISQAVIAMASSLGLEVIAEGMETEEQRDFLINSGCYSAQGFLLSKALPEAEFIKLLMKN